MESRQTSDTSYFAQANHRSDRRPVGIKQADRLSHMHIVGMTGVGKSTLIETLAIQDLHAGRGFAVIDPHGDMVERIAAAAETRSDIIYLNAPDSRQPFGYNPLRRVRDDKIPLAVSGFLETLKKLWPDAWGTRMEHILRNSLYALFEQSDARLPDILRLYANDKFRKEVRLRLRNETVRRFWQEEFENYNSRQRSEMIAPIQNKLGALLSDPLLHHVFVQPEKDIHFRSLMDEGGVLLANLAKGRIGTDSAVTLGSLLVSTIALAGFSRAEMPAESRRPFFVYIDEFQNFTTLMLANLMAELRKYGVGLVLANQYLQQLSPDIRNAVLGNAGTQIAFRVGADDAGVLARGFEPDFGAQDLMNLPVQSIYLRLMIDGTPSKPFSATTRIKPVKPPPASAAVPLSDFT